jgi:putative chitinase
MAVREFQEQPEKVRVDKPSKGAKEVSGGPNNEGSGSPNVTMVASAAPDAASCWYNYGPTSKPRSHPPLLGLLSKMDSKNPKKEIINTLQDQAFTNDVFESFLIAMNKRLIKNWMGIAKYYFKGSDAPTRQKLYAWFSSDAGANHFRRWCQQLGKQTGKHGNPPPPGKLGSAHYPGKAIDINYDLNPWCPIFNQNLRLPVMTGEEIYEDKKRNLDAAGKKRLIAKDAEIPSQSYADLMAAAGKIYDRALRLLIPTVESNGQTQPASEVEKLNFSISYFAQRYYRNHYDWKQDFDDHKNAPFSADQVYKFLQAMNLSLRVYFNYVYGRFGAPRDINAQFAQLNHINQTHTPRSENDLVSAIKNDFNLGCLPPSSQILIDPETLKVPDPSNPGKEKLSEDAALFESMENVIYPYIGNPTVMYRLKLESLLNDDARLAKALAFMHKQIIMDHHRLSYCMMYNYPDRRDPCNGIFNISYETFLAFCYLPQDAEWLRTFGAFASGQAGDMQHFDYGHTKREAAAGTPQPAPAAAPAPKPPQPAPAQPAAAAVADDDFLTLAQLKATTRCSEENGKKFIEHLRLVMKARSIDTPLRKAHFLAQLGQESVNLSKTEEIDSGKRYENAKRLGNTKPGDGPRFKGKGLIQLTGRNHYTALEKLLKQNLTDDPNPLKLRDDPYLACYSAGWYWATRGTNINKLCDGDDVLKVTYAVNGGYNGFSVRINLLRFGYGAFNIDRPKERLEKWMPFIIDNMQKVTDTLGGAEKVIDHATESAYAKEAAKKKDKKILAPVNEFKHNVFVLWNMDPKDKTYVPPLTRSEALLFLEFRTKEEVNALRKKLGLDTVA